MSGGFTLVPGRLPASPLDETHVKGPDAAARASDEDVRVLTV
ncbi:hypothetical protein PACID_08350 [Acidipropionibacterium acidipropionici ATCC 4875]|uniref:Uncharacterized protein n=1 Tax=Acidipropionibacterium acidipropionici (strain ATCC 4875 / DSM 20272 / JCM 6432 / NBRC 12425 / NCIMB 8070 / 4) TaxID=1171373 RepID=K7RUM8_ACIA4|nr:hypothetical protein PACID_08350 [Acidipropionibacterium acidipropionici ATCC 4875]